MKILGTDFVMFQVTDMTKAVKFYQDTLAFKACHAFASTSHCFHDCVVRFQAVQIDKLSRAPLLSLLLDLPKMLLCSDQEGIVQYSRRGQCAFFKVVFGDHGIGLGIGLDDGDFSGFADPVDVVSNCNG